MVSGDVLRGQFGIAVDALPTEMPKHRLPLRDGVGARCFGSFCSHLHARGNPFLSISRIPGVVYRACLCVVRLGISFASKSLHFFVSFLNGGVRSPFGYRARRPDGFPFLRRVAGPFRYALRSASFSIRFAAHFVGPLGVCRPPSGRRFSRLPRMHRIFPAFCVVRPPTRLAVGDRASLIERCLALGTEPAFSFHGDGFITALDWSQA